MIKYDTLYSRDTKNNIRIWYQEQDENKYRTVSGIKDGNCVTSEFTICEGKNSGKKNETTGKEQAEAEIRAKYKKQLKTGYVLSIDDIDNTGFEEPMLAKKLKDREDKVTFPAMLDRKYNGGRVIGKKEGLFSRKGEVWQTIPHIFEELKELFKVYPDLVIDGEGYNHEYRFKLNELMSILRKTKNITKEDLDKSEKIIRYYVYDSYGFDNITEETGCEERRKALKKLFSGFKYIVPVDYVIVNNLEELYTVYQSFVDDGYEGAMYRTINAPYVHNRSSDLLKVKPEDSSEAIIKEIFEGEGNWSGAAKTATLDWNGIVFDATFKGSHEDLGIIFNDKNSWLNREITFLYNGLTGLKKPNFARIDISNCFKS